MYHPESNILLHNWLHSVTQISESIYKALSAPCDLLLETPRSISSVVNDRRQLRRWLTVRHTTFWLSGAADDLKDAGLTYTQSSFTICIIGVM